MYHEVGHLIFKQYSDSLISAILPEVSSHFTSQKQLAVDQNKSGKLIDLLKEIEANWNNGWIEEFTCDIIGTYLVGPAYAWTNLKLTTNSTYFNAVYKPSVSHPSDESRNKAIIATLKLQGYKEEEINKIESSWESFQKYITDDYPEYYDYYFPDSLIQRLVEYVVKGCRDIALKSHIEQVEKCGLPISQILNEAWYIARNKPQDFSDWEKSAIEKIDKSLNEE